MLHGKSSYEEWWFFPLSVVLCKWDQEKHRIKKSNMKFSWGSPLQYAQEIEARPSVFWCKYISVWRCMSETFTIFGTAPTCVLDNWEREGAQNLRNILFHVVYISRKIEFDIFMLLCFYGDILCVDVSACLTWCHTVDAPHLIPWGQLGKLFSFFCRCLLQVIARNV